MGWVVSVTPWPRFRPWERTPGTHCTGGWVGPRAVLDIEARGKILSPLPRIEPRSPGRSARSKTLYWLSYPAQQENTLVQILHHHHLILLPLLLCTTVLSAKLLPVSSSMSLYTFNHSMGAWSELIYFPHKFGFWYSELYVTLCSPVDSCQRFLMILSHPVTT
jgi:hypothetical protein